MKNLCIFCPIVWRLDQISGTVRPCNWSSPEMVPLSRPPAFVPNSTLVNCLLEKFWADRWRSPLKPVLNLNLSDLLLSKLKYTLQKERHPKKNVEPRQKSDSGLQSRSHLKILTTWNIDNLKYWQLLLILFLIQIHTVLYKIFKHFEQSANWPKECRRFTYCACLLSHNHFKLFTLLVMVVAVVNKYNIYLC